MYKIGQPSGSGSLSMVKCHEFNGVVRVAAANRVRMDQATDKNPADIEITAMLGGSLEI